MLVRRARVRDLSLTSHATCSPPPAPPGRASGILQQQQPQSVMVVTTGSGLYGKMPCPTTCPFCRNSITTSVIVQPGCFTYESLLTWGVARSGRESVPARPRCAHARSSRRRMQVEPRRHPLHRRRLALLPHPFLCARLPGRCVAELGPAPHSRVATLGPSLPYPTLPYPPVGLPCRRERPLRISSATRTHPSRPSLQRRTRARTATRPSASSPALAEEPYCARHQSRAAAVARRLPSPHRSLLRLRPSLSLSPAGAQAQPSTNAPHSIRSLRSPMIENRRLIECVVQLEAAAKTLQGVSRTLSQTVFQASPSAVPAVGRLPH